MQSSAGKKEKINGKKRKFDDDWSSSKVHSKDSRRHQNQNKRNQKREQETA